MNQSGKLLLLIVLIGILLSIGITACTTNQNNLTEKPIEASTQTNSEETGSTSTPIPGENNSSTPVNMSTLKAEIQPTFNATLHVDQRAEPHLLAILGSYDPTVPNEATISFASDGKSFVMHNSAKLSIWRTSPLKEIRNIPILAESNVQKIALSEDNHYVAAIFTNPQTENSHLFVWKVITGEAIINQDLGNMQDSAVGSRQQSAVWEAYELAFIPGTNTIAFKNGQNVQIMDVEGDLQPVQLKLRDDMTAQKITFTRDGRFMYVLLYILSHEDQAYFQVQIWDTNTLRFRESVSLEDLDTGIDVDLQASYILIKNSDEMSLQKMSMENEEVEGLPYRLGSYRITADGLFMVFQHIPDDSINRQYDIEFWSVYNWRTLYVLDNDGEGVNINYPIDLSTPNEILFNRDHTLMAICNNGKAYLYDISGIFTIR